MNETLADVAKSDRFLADQVAAEEARQSRQLELIPSENYAFPEVLALLGSVFTNRYAEGYPGSRYYGGQDHTDRVEELARARARSVFGAEHANVQPLSGSPMNQAVYLAVLEPGDPVMAMELSHGGHLTHGAPVSHMGRLFRFERYRTRPDGSVDADELRALALRHRPKLVVCGTSSCPRLDDYAAYRAVADEVGALAMADVSHVGGLIAAGVLPNPFDHGFDFVTTTTHKTLRGPRGGLILCRSEWAKPVDRSVFPGLQGGPHMNQVAATAYALGRAARPDHRAWSERVLRNARALAVGLLAEELVLVTGGTDNHLIVVDTVASVGADGAAAERALETIGVAVNKQLVPDDPRPPLRPSGVRLGTPAATTRGMGEDEMRMLAACVGEALRRRDEPSVLGRLRRRVEALCEAFPVPGLDPAIPSGRADREPAALPTPDAEGRLAG